MNRAGSTARSDDCFSGDQISGKLLVTSKLDNGGTSATRTGPGYSVQAGDFALLNHVLTDDATLGWNDLCNDPAQTLNTNCNRASQEAHAASQATIVKNPSQTTTTIRNANGDAVTTVESGTSYTGFKPYTLTAADKTLAMQLHDVPSAYNIDGVPTC